MAGHETTTLMDAEVTGIAGTIAVAGRGSQASVAFVPNGETRFRVAVGEGTAVYEVNVEADLEAALRIPLPPLVQLTHHPERTEQVTRTVHLHRPGDSDSDSETATATCEDGATASATATAYAYVPSVTIAKQVTVDVLHKEHVKAETVERSPIAGSRDEALALASSVGADDPFEVLVLPEPEPVESPAEQEPADGDPKRLVRPSGMGVAVVRRLLTATLLIGTAWRPPARSRPRSRPCWTPSTGCSPRWPTPPSGSASSPSSGRASS